MHQQLARDHCRPTAIDLFAGAGGLSVGFKQAGFSVPAANDFDVHAAASYRMNSPNTCFLPDPLEQIAAVNFLHASNLAYGELDVLVGGPPCQAFSVYNHGRGMHDERSGLFRHYLRIVSGLMPRFVVIENVTGIASIDKGSAVDEIVGGLNGLGYFVDARILKAEEYGVPQQRRRLFFLGARDSCSIEWPKATNSPSLSVSSSSRSLRPLVTVADAISDLPPLYCGDGSDEMEYSSEAHSAYQLLLRLGSDRVFNHFAPRLAAVNLERIPHIPQGGSWRNLPYRLLPAGMKRARRSDHTKRYGRLHPDLQACTILTKCDLHWGAYIHPEQDRTITVREAARFQSFPDSFRFQGSRGEQYRQVGNAVPPLLAQAVAQGILSMMGNQPPVEFSNSVCD